MTFANKIIPFLLVVFVACQAEKTSYISQVDLMIGTAPASTPGATKNGGDHVDNGQTIPAVTAPFGMTQWVPQTRDTEKKCLAPFYYQDNKLQGFRATHWTSGSCVQDYGSFTLMPISGNFNWLPNLRSADFLIDKDNLTPAYGSIQIPEYKVVTELTSTKRCGIMRFSWENPDRPAIIIDVNSDEGQGFLQIDPEKREVIAGNPVHRIYNGSGKAAGFSGYMVMQFDCDFEKFGTYADSISFADSTIIENRKQSGGYVFLKLNKEMVSHVKIGTSFTSIENARNNLDIEIPEWDFESTRKALEDEWNNLLGTIRVSGGAETDQVKFYTALYHSCLHPRIYSDCNGSYPSFAGNTAIQKAEGFEYYNDFSAWDTYRAQMPLLSLIAPSQYLDMVKSLVKMAEQGGWLPIFPMWNSYTSAMIGDHCASIIGDAIMKGFDPDIETAWKYMIKNAFETPDSLSYIDGKGRRALTSYLKYGYIPLEDEVPFAFHRREQVSRTLEYAYDDWVIGRVAEKMGKETEKQEFFKRAKNYVNVYDPQKGWVCGRFADGRFTDDFKAHRGMSYITEGSPMHYTWSVPQDIPGLMSLMGGKEAFYNKLETLINEKRYWHGNEPSHHIPYLFNYAGRWDKTQEVVKMILETEYTAEPGGLSGNDDAGQMSAWYAFSAIGFYPVCPGSNEYQLSSPIFSRVEFHPDLAFYPGGSLILDAKENSPARIFTSAKLKGKELEGILTHEQIREGGKITFR